MTDPTGAALRVGIDIRTLDAASSGLQRYLWRLGAWLADRGHDVGYLTVRRPDAVELPPGTQLHDLHAAGRRELRRRVAALELDVLLLNPERSRRYRGIGANVLRPAYGTEHYRQKLRSFRTPLRSLGRRALRYAPWELLEQRWERGFYERRDPAPDVIAVSQYMRAEVLDSYDIPPDHVHVVHTGVDVGEFNPERRAELRAAERARLGLPDAAVCLLFMGHNFRLKGLWQLLDIVRRLRAEPGGVDLHLIVAGRGTGERQRRQARRSIARHGLQRSVHLMGPVQPAMRAFAAADAFIHLAWHDAFANVTLEALAAGLPVITTPFNGASEVIEHDVSGLLVDPGDDAAVMDGVRRLLDAAVRGRLGGAAAAVGSQRPQERNFEQVLAVMRSARARRSGPVR